MDKQRIEELAVSICRNIWKERYQIWPDQELNPMDILDPELVCDWLGISYEGHDDLGRFGNGGIQFEVAGAIDIEQRLITISKKFSLEEQRFTAAHEIGHSVMHAGGMVMHRDRPLKSQQIDRYLLDPNGYESEANYFAGCLLMPPKLLRAKVEERFGSLPICFDDNVAFQFDQQNPDRLIRAPYDSREREVALATCKRYGDRHFVSLKDEFKVSVTAMAIRLQELKFVKWP